jgi:hypothetical protein
MKKILAILILIFTLQTPSQADDIQDFQIEGMSVGDSLLHYFSEEEIINAKKTTYPSSKKFNEVHILADSNIYNQFSFAIKLDDKKYIIHALSGDINFVDDLTGCLKQKKEIVEEFSSIYSNTKKKTYTYKYKNIADGKSISKVTNLDFQDGSSIRVWCNSWTKQAEKEGFRDMLSINISTYEINNWLSTEAYK